MGIDILYANNTFHLSDAHLILNLPRLLVPSRLASITSLEMLWKIHPFRDQQPNDPPFSDKGTFLELAQQTPDIFPSLRRAYISLQGDLAHPYGSPLTRGFDSKAGCEFQEKALLTYIDAMVRRLAHIDVFVLALPSSLYGLQKHQAIARGEARIHESRSINGNHGWR